jgi:hypothetical protein
MLAMVSRETFDRPIARESSGRYPPRRPNFLCTTHPARQALGRTPVCAQPLGPVAPPNLLPTRFRTQAAPEDPRPPGLIQGLRKAVSKALSHRQGMRDDYPPADRFRVTRHAFSLRKPCPISPDNAGPSIGTRSVRTTPGADIKRNGKPGNGNPARPAFRAGHLPT